MMTPTMTPMMMPIEPFVSTAKGPVSGGGGGGATFDIVGESTTASTVIETPVTFAKMRVALLGLLIKLIIVDCTEAAIAVVVWMLTLTRTLPGDMVNSTTDGSTPARAAVAFLIWVCTLSVNEEMSPSSKRMNFTTLNARGEGVGGEGSEGGGGTGSGGEGGGSGEVDGSGGGGGGVDGSGGGGGGGEDGSGGEGGGGEGGGEGDGGGGDGGGGDGSGGGDGGGGDGGGVLQWLVATRPRTMCTSFIFV